MRDTLLEQVTYFENNQHRMSYRELREEGWPIGSGMVESGAKQFKDRWRDWARPFERPEWFVHSVQPKPRFTRAV